jgi:hypothetical protein
LAPPSFPSFLSLKTRLRCLHLLLPTASFSSATYFIFGPLAACTIFPTAVASYLYYTGNQVIFSTTVPPGLKKLSPGSVQSVTARVLRGAGPLTLCFKRFR